jgi:hypothetical protein
MLFVSYKFQYKDAYNIDFRYGLTLHFLSVRRLLLPSMTDYHSNLYILLFSGLLNLLFCLYIGYMIFAGFFFPRDEKSFALLVALAIIYFLVPSQIAGSGVLINERLVLPFLAILIHVARVKTLDRRPIILFTALVVVNIGLFHHYYEVKGPDYRNALLNKEWTDLSMRGAQDIIEEKPVDAIDSAVIYTTGLVGTK